MIEFTCSLNALLGMAGASSSNGIKQQAANAAVHIQRGDKCLQFAAQNGRLTVLFRAMEKTDRLKEVCWTDDEERVVSVPLRMILGELEKMPKTVIVRVEYTRCTITPQSSDGASGSWCPRWRVPTQRTLFPDLTRLPKPSPDDLQRAQGMTPDLATIALLMKTAKKLGAGSMQPPCSFFGEAAVESIGVRFPDLPGFYAVMKALPYDTIDCAPPAWLLDSEALPGVSSLAHIFFRHLSEAERQEREAEAEPPKEKKKRGRKAKAQPGQTVLENLQQAQVGLGESLRADGFEVIIPGEDADETPVEEPSQPGPLEWDGTYDDEDHHVYEACSCQCAEPGDWFRYRITECADELYRLHSDAELMQDGDGELVFAMLEDAKAFCQMREDEAIAAFAEEQAREEAEEDRPDALDAITDEIMNPDLAGTSEDGSGPEQTSSSQESERESTAIPATTEPPKTFEHPERGLCIVLHPTVSKAYFQPAEVSGDGLQLIGPVYECSHERMRVLLGETEDIEQPRHRGRRPKATSITV